LPKLDPSDRVVYDASQFSLKPPKLIKNHVKGRNHRKGDFMVAKPATQDSVQEIWRPALAEFIATLLFIFLGAGTVVVTGGILQESLTSARLLVIALAHGLTIALLVSATAKISGGHINPAVTLAALVTGKIAPGKALMYIAAQLIGGILGAFLLTMALPSDIQGNLGAHGLNPEVSAGAGLLTEIVLTFALVFVIFATAVDPKGLGHIAPAAIGLTVLVDHLFGVPITGASMNPARSFGPALVAGAWENHWIFWVGPVIGGVLAAWVYEMLFMGRKE
jgi:MIP family channel proteins